jgi:hypothetical protein
MFLKAQVKWNTSGILSVLISVASWIYWDWIPPRYLPHSHHLAVIMGPGAIISASAFAGAACSRGSKWWLLALIGPISCALLLLTAST